MGYLETTFNDTSQMARLISALKGKAKILVDSNDEEIVYFIQQLLNVQNKNLEIQLILHVKISLCLALN